MSHSRQIKSKRPKPKRLAAVGLHRIVSLSFEVTAIIERQQFGAVYHETILQHYMTLEKLTIRGKPWPIGSKVDFKEIKTG